MVKALVLKELREIAGITALALVAYALALGSVTGAAFLDWLRFWSSSPSQIVPFLNPAFANLLCGISALYALALGFRQSAWEHSRHTYLFLLHRPVARSRIFLIKSGIGLAVLLAASGVCVLCYAIWAATPRTHPGPFFWSMTESCWRDCLGFSLIYLGAFLSGLRSARWFGTRMLPLVASLLVFAIVWQALPGVVIPAAIVVTFNSLLAVAVCHVAATQDYS